MSIIEFLRNTKQKILTQSLPGIRKKPLNPKFLVFFIILGLVNIILGIILFIPYSLFSINFPYQTGNSSFPFTVTKPTETLYLYLQIKNFYQSHSFYAKSFSASQLKGKPVTNINSCKPLKFDNGRIIYPCGLIANTFNQDTFSITGANNVIISEDDIAWTSNIKRIKNTTYTLDQITAPPLWQPYTEVPQLQNNQRFANWMGTASFPNFRKLYGKINGLEKGVYVLNVQSDFLYGEKSVFLTESSWAGVRNYFMAVMMIIIGVFLLLTSTLMWLKINLIR